MSVPWCGCVEGGMSVPYVEIRGQVAEFVLPSPHGSGKPFTTRVLEIEFRFSGLAGNVFTH